MKNLGICVILNVGSGNTKTKSQPDIIHSAFAALGVEITLKVITKGSQLIAETKNALDEGYTIIVAAGGDGTICAVAAVLSGSEALLGILPLGTFNYFARSLNLPMDTESAAKVIIEGHSVPLRIGKVNDSLFLNNASMGTYPAILKAREDIYNRWGRSRIAAYWAVIKTLVTLRRPLHLRITVDGEARNIRSPLVFIVNNAYQLEQMKLEGADHIKAGNMALFIAPDATRFGMVRHALAVALGRAASERNFELLGGQKIDIQNLRSPARGKSTIAMDGERERLQGPFKFRVVMDALRVIVPAGHTAEVR